MLGATGEYMKDFLKGLKILPRWIIISLDLGIIGFSVILAYFLRFNFDLVDVAESTVVVGVWIYVISSFLMFFLTQSYAGIIRYTSLEDGWRVTYTMFFITLVVLAVNMASNWVNGISIIPYSVIIMASINSSMFLFFYRLLVKSIFSFYFQNKQQKNNVVIFGAGTNGRVTKQIIEGDPSSNLNVIGFLEDNRNKIGKSHSGVRIYDARRYLGRLTRNYNVKEIILAITSLEVDRKNEIVDDALRLGLKIREVPPVEKWVGGGFSLREIKDVKIEDLLGREMIRLDNDKLANEIEDKVILITGAAGSIGSELVRQVVYYKPAKVIMVDQSETGIYHLKYEMDWAHHLTDLAFYVGDITNRDRMLQLFSQHHPQIVYHAAAYKHVPLMESNPSEAVHCNVFGTKVVSDISVEFNVEKFVFVSTDKAVNPTNVMGASKRIAEMYIQALQGETGQVKLTKFITTRFGNVLGSNGSVIPLFKKQIEQGGPITVTHSDIVRYFMTISEAVQLVLEAGAMGSGGEIFLFDMGRSIKIIDLAKKMIRLSGLEPDIDIKIQFIGLRDGEKLYEELLSELELTKQTYHKKILIADLPKVKLKDIQAHFNTLSMLLGQKDENKLVRHMKDMVPEYVSNASRFEMLDKKVAS